MPQYQVPQFIEVENPIIGPLTIYQFLWFAGGGAVCIVLYFILSPLFFFLAALLIMGIAAAFAFVKIENKPFLYYVSNLLSFSLKPQIYEWQSPVTDKPYDFTLVKKQDITKKTTNSPKELSKSKIQELAWRLDLGISQADSDDGVAS